MRSKPFLAAALLLATVLAACSSGASSAPGSAAPTSAAPSEPAASPSGANSAAVVNLADTDLGMVLVDGQGRTLYAFTPDTNGESTCYDDCAANWPALTTSGDVTPGEGLEADDFGTVARTDGTTQVTFYGKPLYTFANDAAPGDTNGQGVADKWYVVDAEGELVRG
ncbi:MAG TPA: hypothetical protein VH720_02020 [Candidatus Limnocylindrales bacterium]|jgi:predicted lipoprotein with Yx(FWY)xxD motif